MNGLATAAAMVLALAPSVSPRLRQQALEILAAEQRDLGRGD